MVSRGAGVSLTRSEPPGAGNSSPRAGILLDRDGTIIVDHGYVGSVDQVEFIEGSPEAIASFNRAGIPVAVVTNQAGVARGLYGIDDVARVHRYIADRLAEYGAQIDLFAYCPYHPEGVVEAFARASEDRKPAPGMATAPRTSAWRRPSGRPRCMWGPAARSAPVSGHSRALPQLPRSSWSVLPYE